MLKILFIITIAGLQASALDRQKPAEENTAGINGSAIDELPRKLESSLVKPGPEFTDKSARRLADSRQTDSGGLLNYFDRLSDFSSRLPVPDWVRTTAESITDKYIRPLLEKFQKESSQAAATLGSAAQDTAGENKGRDFFSPAEYAIEATRSAFTEKEAPEILGAMKRTSIRRNSFSRTNIPKASFGGAGTRQIAPTPINPNSSVEKFGNSKL